MALQVERHYSPRFIESWAGKVSKLFLLTMTILVIKSSECSKVDFVCDDVLRRDRFDPVFAWNSTNCNLHFFKYEDVTECFDQLPSHLQLNGKRFHVVFVGDSRIRYAFHSFWPTLPNYDLTWKGDVVDRKFLSYHHDIEIDSAILNTRVTFLWRTKIQEGLPEFMKWDSGTSEVPSVLITSFSSYHMFQNEPLGYVVYEQEMNKLVPVLKSLASKMHVIWWHQNPIIETYGNKNHGVAIDRSAANHKYKNYMALARRLLRDTGVLYWESSARMAEEYIRSCGINDRTDVTNLRACFDYIHTGYLIYDRGTQVILNAMCNRLLGNNTNPSVIFNGNTCCV